MICLLLLRVSGLDPTFFQTLGFWIQLCWQGFGLCCATRHCLAAQCRVARPELVALLSFQPLCTPRKVVS